VRISSRFTILAVLSGLLIPAALFAADVPFEQRLPDKIAFFASIPEFGQFKERFANTSYGRLIEDPQVAEYREQLEKWMRASAAEENFLPPGIELDELFEIPEGEVAVAMTLPGRKASSFAVSLEFGDSLDTVEKLIDEAVAKSVEAEWKEDEVEFQGSRITTLEGPVNPNRPKQKPVKLAFVIEDSTLILSSSLELCQEILDRWDGKADGSLAENEIFRHVIDSTTERDRAPVARWYMNIADLIQGAFASADASNMILNVARGNIGRVGVLEFRGMGGSVDLATDGFDSIFRTAAWVDEPVTGFLSVFTFPVDDVAPPAWVPADSPVYLSGNWDIERAYTSVESLYDTIMGAGRFNAGVQEIAADERGPKVHIKLDLINLLGGKIHFMQSNLTGDQDSPVPNVLAAFEVTDQQKAEELLEKVATTAGSPFESREYRDTKIWSMKAPQNGPAFAVAHDCIFLSSDGGLLESAIRADPDVKRLADDKSFKHQTSRMPKRVSLFGVQRSEQQVQALYKLLKSGGLAGDGAPDPATLPEFDVIKHYFLPGVTYAVPNARGFEYVTYSLANDVSE
jgi:hypothetical protein